MRYIMTLEEKHEYLTELLEAAPDTFKFRLVTYPSTSQVSKARVMNRLEKTHPSRNSPSKAAFEWMNNLYKELKKPKYANR